MAADGFDYTYKIIVIGDSGVGKTCLLLRYAENTFNQSFISTLGVDFKVRTITIEEKKIKLQIWDTAGQDRFRFITTSYYRGANGIILVYDVTNKRSFQNITRWIQDVDSNTDGVERLLVGNKCDNTEHRVISEDMGRELARDHSIPFIESSAKTGINISEAFEMLATAIFKKGCAGQKKEGDADIQTPAGNQKDGKGGCGC
eukprot:Em0023g234a